MIIQKIIEHEGKKYPMNIVYFPREEIERYSYYERDKIRGILFDCGFWGADISSFFLVFFKPCENWNIHTPMTLYQKLSDHSNLFRDPQRMFNEIKQFQYLKYKIPDISDEFIKKTVFAIINFSEDSIQVGNASFHKICDDTSRVFKLVLKYNKGDWFITGLRTYDNIFNCDKYFLNGSSTDASFYDLVNYYFKKNESIPIEVNVQERTNILYFLQSKNIHIKEILKNGDLITYKEKYDISRISHEIISNIISNIT